MLSSGQLHRHDSWRASEGESAYGRHLRAGHIIAIDHPGMRHQPWVIHEVTPHEEDWRLILRPYGAEFDFAQHNRPMRLRKHGRVFVLPEHFSRCSRCNELPPCSEVWTATVSSAHAEKAARYEVEGVCPACQKPVTHRQRSHRFEENLFVPLGPPVVFHARASCFASAVDYDAQLARAHDREPTLSCPGMHVQHNDGHHECTNITCPGFHARHRTFACCYVLRERCNRPECWERSG
ncbi:hypothetical protein [Microbacterium arborescens]|uniref:hypothetical protein n=1 Tax=Microbacterium arborescens TaxID=33883 RepID=UPI000DF73B61|nr:hypothetical protein [Microbacterium arborescens]